MEVVAKANLELEATCGSRREEPRRRLLLSTRAHQSASGPAVDILNISSGGMLMRTDATLDLEEAVIVVLPEAGERSAQIVWNSGDLYGCRFQDALNPGELSAIQLKARPLDPIRASNRKEFENDETFGRRLKRLRMESDYSMVGLAAATGVTKPTLWKWETERVRPRQKALANLAQVLGVSESFLLFGIGDGQDDDRQEPPGNLAETIAISRSMIADLAGVPTEKVAIDIDFG